MRNRVLTSVFVLLSVGCSSVGTPEGQCNSLKPIDVLVKSKLIQGTNDDKLSKLKFTFKNGEIGPIARKLDGGHISEVDITPNIAYMVDAGWILGFNHGEWGGALTFKGSDGTEYRIFKANVHNIYEHPLGYVVVSGLNHLNTNLGAIHLINLKSGVYTELKSNNLVSSPKSTWQNTSGGIVIKYDKESYSIFDSAGRLTNTNCRKPIDGS